MSEIETTKKDLVPQEPWEDKFLEVYLTKFGSMREAAKEIGISYEKVRYHAIKSPAFKEKIQAAREIARGELEDRADYEAIRRMFEAQEKPIYHRGEFVGYEYVYDNKHLEWMLERLFPEKYHLPTRIEFAGDKNGSIEFKLQLGDRVPGDDQDSEED